MPDPTNPAAPCGDPHDPLDTLAHYALAECARRGKGHAGGVNQAIDKLREVIDERCAPMPPPNQPAAHAVDPREVCAQVCESRHSSLTRTDEALEAIKCAAAIRALPPFAAQPNKGPDASPQGVGSRAVDASGSALAAQQPPVERWRRFNETTGACGYAIDGKKYGGHQHPDRCKCQGTDTTPHKHYSDAPHRCARCGKCDAYEPWDAAQQQSFDMLAHLRRQREWSERTFGPGARTAGVVDHIRKELREIEADPADVSEWIDVAILALDGAWRAGFQPQQIIDALVAKQAKNEARQWPDWRTAPADKAIEHVKPAQQPSEAVLRLCRAARNCMRTVERESRDEYDALRSALAAVEAEGGR